MSDYLKRTLNSDLVNLAFALASIAIIGTFTAAAIMGLCIAWYHWGW